jgi:hypothetical protein
MLHRAPLDLDAGILGEKPQDLEDAERAGHSDPPSTAPLPLKRLAPLFMLNAMVISGSKSLFPVCEFYIAQILSGSSAFALESERKAAGHGGYGNGNCRECTVDRPSG